MYFTELNEVSKQKLIAKTVSFWPSWIYNTLASRLSISELDHYRKLRKYLSVRDVCQISLVNQIVRNFIDNKNSLTWFHSTKNTEDLVGYLMESFKYPQLRITTADNYNCNGFSDFSQPDLTASEQKEFFDTFELLTQSSEFFEQLLFQLGFIEEKNDDSLAYCIESPITSTQRYAHQALSEKPYKTVLHPDGVIVVFEENAFQKIKEKKDILEFFRSILKELYAIDDFSSVNRTPIYEAYLNHL